MRLTCWRWCEFDPPAEFLLTQLCESRAVATSRFADYFSGAAQRQYMGQKLTSANKKVKANIEESPFSIGKYGSSEGDAGRMARAILSASGS